MWLINVSTRQLEFFVDETSKPYAILSHTWGEEEVTFRDIQHGHPEAKKGYVKIKDTCTQAQKDGIDYVWIDTWYDEVSAHCSQ